MSRPALSWAGINSGSYVTGWLRYPTVQTEIDAGRPIESRIQWSSGGGHMHVIYGYDTANSWVYWGDPWPSSYRYNWASHAWYVGNELLLLDPLALPDRGVSAR